MVYEIIMQKYRSNLKRIGIKTIQYGVPLAITAAGALILNDVSNAYNVWKDLPLTEYLTSSFDYREIQGIRYDVWSKMVLEGLFGFVTSGLGVGLILKRIGKDSNVFHKQ